MYGSWPPNPKTAWIRASSAVNTGELASHAAGKWHFFSHGSELKNTLSYLLTFCFLRVLVCAAALSAISPADIGTHLPEDMFTRNRPVIRRDEEIHSMTNWKGLNHHSHAPRINDERELKIEF